MIPYRSLSIAAIILASLGGAFAYGSHTATVSAERDALALEVTTRRNASVLGVQLQQADRALLVEQRRTSQVQNVEVIKYVKVYRDKIVEVPSIVKCVDNSGLLDIINATTPTATPTE